MINHEKAIALGQCRVDIWLAYHIKKRQCARLHSENEFFKIAFFTKADKRSLFWAWSIVLCMLHK
jgi:hypothetical protein